MIRGGPQNSKTKRVTDKREPHSGLKRGWLIIADKPRVEIKTSRSECSIPMLVPHLDHSAQTDEGKAVESKRSSIWNDGRCAV